jgi:hypothetical protein
MTAIADITVKKFDGTTDILWSAVAGSGGDKSPAVWRSNTATGTLGQKPTINMSSKWNSSADVRRVDVSGVYPSTYTNSATGLTEIRSKMTFQGSFAVPQNINTADINEFVAQITNLLVSSLMRGSIISGYAPA